MSRKTGTLYVVATPIGNLEDITLRALRILREVDLIAAEDTRQTTKLLQHYGIRKFLLSYHEHNERRRTEELLAQLRAGRSVALVSDAGTPGISDPGYQLIRACVEEGIPVVPVPGPSAVLAALAASGLATDRFLFAGFVPRKSSERHRFFEELKEERGTLILFESPERILESLRDLQAVMGDRRVAVCRELTKVHEEVFRGRISDAIAHLGAHPPRGEITLVVEGASPRSPEDEKTDEDLRRLLAQGESVRDAAEVVARAYGISRREAYRRALRIRGEGRA
ncbi:MAG: 16S rRNA (cytidine(1402)-2'-O)-methyltransferase [Armatimonadota bacterium]|nr:16S rRNA (cytidine(1402)-2'-O)-methyltransferase [Armatimonadota bacterium]MDR7443863.1 16S rRNA (cytidine(1402)-2'-O)-methyltransferase [Armatimonadota bacterium]MDR7571228.1 16S rRNA (cytidine(1402)-2'-O)-methyltransferase [Armatimonadota bacterium]MDR7615493.1 16S rRNA (cytidine(1402)-2'-O)-methyltransferase [Armatimonadota bacterium]